MFVFASLKNIANQAKFCNFLRTLTALSIAVFFLVKHDVTSLKYSWERVLWSTRNGSYTLTISSTITLQIVRTSFRFRLRGCMGSCAPSLPPPSSHQWYYFLFSIIARSVTSAEWLVRWGQEVCLAFPPFLAFQVSMDRKVPLVPRVSRALAVPKASRAPPDLQVVMGPKGCRGPLARQGLETSVCVITKRKQVAVLPKVTAQSIQLM